MSTFITPLLETHWPVVAEIYREGIATGNATFQKEIPSWSEWAKVKAALDANRSLSTVPCK